MYVCICKGVTESDILATVKEGALSYAQVREKLGVASCCGRCAPEAKSLVSEQVAKVAASISYAA